jgi:hypothetical protein
LAEGEGIDTGGITWLPVASRARETPPSAEETHGFPVGEKAIPHALIKLGSTLAPLSWLLFETRLTRLKFVVDPDVDELFSSLWQLTIATEMINASNIAFERVVVL